MIRKTLLFILYFFIFVIVSAITLLSWHIYYYEISKEYARKKWEQQIQLEAQSSLPKKSGNPEVQTVFIFNQLDGSYTTVFDKDTKVLRFKDIYYIPIIPLDATELIEWSDTNIFTIKRIVVNNMIQSNNFFQTTDHQFIKSFCSTKKEANDPLSYNVEPKDNFDNCVQDVSTKPTKDHNKDRT